MAIINNGMNANERAILTKAMADSGSKLNFGNFPEKKIDKHGTGGIGDKTSIILAPLMAELGYKVPMISGRAFLIFFNLSIILHNFLIL